MLLMTSIYDRRSVVCPLQNSQVRPAGSRCQPEADTLACAGRRPAYMLVILIIKAKDCLYVCTTVYTVLLAYLLSLKIQQLIPQIQGMCGLIPRLPRHP